MGYWGHLVLVRGDQPPSEFRGHAEPQRDYGGGWRVYRADGELPDLPGAVRALAARAATPVLAAYVLDSDCAAIVAATPTGQVWSSMLNPDFAAQEYGATVPDTDADLAAALRWATDAGLVADDHHVREALRGSATFVEDLFFALIDALGVPAV